MNFQLYHDLTFDVLYGGVAILIFVIFERGLYLSYLSIRAGRLARAVGRDVRAPQLRAAENFAQLQSTLGQIEDTLQNARRYYNAAVRDLNTRVEQFPSNLVAGMGNFKPREFFEISAPAEREAPHVSFSATPTA